ncbi:MAG TPA: copper chaperone [Ignavibacteria bacterium]|nr:copper chaperone [Ignavibacteria bacterium]
MSCSGCAGRIYRALSQYDGVIRSSVDYKNRNVSVKFDEQKISGNKIKEIINTIGFEVIQNVEN